MPRNLLMSIVACFALIACAPITSASQVTGASQAGGTVDVTHTVVFRNLAQCMPSRSLRRSLARDGGLVLPDGREIFPRYSETKGNDGYMLEGQLMQTVTQNSSIEFPSNARWNGLPITKVESELVLPPEADSTSIIRLHFAAPAEELRSNLSRLGVDAPIAPAYRAIGEEFHPPCGGAIQIQTSSNGSALTCTAGC